MIAAAIIVLTARGVTTLPGVNEFLERYPGDYNPREAVDPGFPAWVRWTHFLNFFLMVLIIRSGWLVRSQQRPPASWTSKRGGQKISINLWLHTSLDVLWLGNGLIFVVLLFLSGHWVRIVPTSWQVFPNAASALLQYLTLQWPVENGWINFNALQQIMYFVVVFVASPLAAITGVRMSVWWPSKATRLNRIYPATLARAIHFPTMLFFAFFILVHVLLVMSTGALRNLNHMFAGTDLVNWTGFWLFATGLATTVGAVFATRPVVLAPIAGLFGTVSKR
ncbi:cytochrome b/b6 domain-containing protein [Arthrobacter sp. 2MCAF15]|uniref:cytochrome b/b6 domain-containing protein n=1 Tax=Arthrobacter sp. 2MCAF15 TaxID=3232984 RepID=UPI003F939945